MLFALYFALSASLFGKKEQTLKGLFEGNFTVSISRPRSEEDEIEVLHLVIENTTNLKLYKDEAHTELVAEEVVSFSDDENTLYFQDTPFVAEMKNQHPLSATATLNSGYYVRFTAHLYERIYILAINKETDEVLDISLTRVHGPPSFMQKYGQIISFLPMAIMMFVMQRQNKKIAEAQQKKAEADARKKKAEEAKNKEEKGEEEEEKGEEEEEKGEEEEKKEKENPEEEKKEEGKVE